MRVSQNHLSHEVQQAITSATVAEIDRQLDEEVALAWSQVNVHIPVSAPNVPYQGQQEYQKWFRQLFRTAFPIDEVIAANDYASKNPDYKVIQRQTMKDFARMAKEIYFG